METLGQGKATTASLGETNVAGEVLKQEQEIWSNKLQPLGKRAGRISAL
jgi:hypothetical protein